jgi:2-polyprenyl-3-methyl-5-hydroxy-6-metoxy-1,4-benzoquinol methylase
MSLKIIAVEGKNSQPASAGTERSKQIATTQGKWERRWLQEADRFNPNRSAAETIRLKKSWSLLSKNVTLRGCKTCDLGSGWGTLATQADHEGAEVTAVDIASGALKKLPPGIELHRDALPQTSLNDGTYDLIIATEILAELPSRDHRLLISELHRLCKSDGCLLLSSAIDINSWNAADQFKRLLQTDLVIEELHSLHLAYGIRLLNFLKAPSRLSSGRQKASSRIGKWCCRWCKRSPARQILRLLAFFLAPLVRQVERSEWLLLFLEKVGQWLNPDGTISHLILLAKPKIAFDIEKPKKWKKKVKRESKSNLINH